MIMTGLSIILIVIIGQLTDVGKNCSLIITLLAVVKILYYSCMPVAKKTAPLGCQGNTS